MLFLEILHVIFGLIFFMFLPGFFLNKLIFSESEIWETLAFSILFSLAISLLLGLFLGVNETMANLTGGITEFNLWFYMFIIVLLFSFLILIKNFSSFKNPF
ncbi:hypothetical protein HOK68_00550, partial [Candidatus Woesearchaeota archaeon]|jgi:uncharacterized membrane protein|nr:hypothetical protein [Candidatus Woesearchaeota archaeon]MBT7296257.1 hypothetical protein [Candidatus Woesearchaeota archaeon]